MDRVHRRLATVLAADAVGYSRLTGRGEEGAIATLRAHRQVIDRVIEQHEGRVFGSAGDSVVAEFASPVEAVRCATEIQFEVDKQNAELSEASRLRFRIGINLGDVVVEGDNLMGDGVNVAARLEALSHPGGMCISEAVYAQARDRLSLEFVDLGEHRVKNIARPVHAYRVPLPSEEQVTSPFRGLNPFEFEDADLFFGRARATAACIERLEQQAANGKAFLLIYGMSGSGKSSLLRAGLLPSITRPGAVAGINFWRRCLVRPSEGPDPVTSLAAGLLHQGALPELACEPAALAQLCWSSPDRALALIRQAHAKAAASAGSVPTQLRLIVAVDQMEELFTTEEEPASREVLVRLLAALAGSGLAWVIATIRSDFFHRCGEVPGFSGLKDGLASYELLPPSGPEIAQIIREPPRAAGLRFEESPDRGRLDDVLQDAAAADPRSLPLLEFVLDALYETGRERRILTFAAYQALGGLDGAIARRADEVVDALPPDIQEELPIVLRALTTVRPGDETVAARPALRAEVTGTPQRLALVQALVAARLLVSDEDAAGHVFVRVAHEALLGRWPRASDIVNSNRSFLETRARLMADAHRWHSDNRNQELLLPSGKRLAEGEELLQSRREEVDDQVIEYIEASSRAQKEREEKDRQAERALIEAAEAARRERLEREAERRSLAAAAASRLAQRTRYAALVATALALMAGAGAFFGFRAQQEATRQAELAEQSADKARSAEKEALEARDQALRNQSLSLSFLSQQTAASGDTEAAILLALEALPKSGSGPARPYLFEAEAALFNALLVHHQTAVFKHDAGVTQAAFNQTGDRIVTASYDKTARIWDVAKGSEIAILKGHQGPVERAGFSPDGRRVITAARDGTARIWDADSGAQRAVLAPVGDYPTAVFDSNGDRVLTAGQNSHASLWDARTGTKLLSVASTGDGLAGFNPDGRSFVTSQERKVFVWNAADGALIRECRVYTYASTLTFSPDGSRLLVGSWGDISYGNFPALWDPSNGTEIARLLGHKSDTQLQGATFSHDGRRIATVSLDGSARIWDGKSGFLLDVLGQESPNLKLKDIDRDDRDVEMNSAFSPNDRLLATASMNGPIRIWDVGRASLFSTITGHRALIEHLEFNPVDSNILLTASHDGTARLWDVDGILTTDLMNKYPPTFAVFSPDNVHLLTGGGDAKGHLWDVAGREIAEFDTGEIVNDATFSPDGSRVATASLSGRVLIWDVAGRREIARLQYPLGLLQVQFSPKGDLLASSSTDGTARLWNAATGIEVATIQTSGRQIVFNPDGDLVLAATSDNAAHLLETNGTELKKLVGHEGRITGAAFSPDGKLVATAALDHTARIWSVKDGSTVAILRGHGDQLTEVAFSPDGQSLLTASRDGTVRIWSVPDGTERVVLRGHTGAVTSAQFSPNGLYVLTASTQDGAARLWAARTGREMAVLASPKEENKRPAPTRAAFNSDGTRVVIVSYEEDVRVIRVFQTPQDLIDFAKQTVPRELTACERLRFFLPVKGDVSDCPS
ncbi:nSTAND1 domain-containing NTPase [Mesorhizobium dulcispinae]|uniref:nSTAND1 domain-containing NTPase n=1 Tax=Mesorhizobium dulcispinae TaxID=3072316 RepID=UPI002A23A800|nr:adenylate/guanylate cyclase domain-containing protein [Mesorhizobium sp. VK23D]MDX8521516.1 adenylate/guanylate cyclase domain-containing protein [Mesorhizobium sp. VK23D]